MGTLRELLTIADKQIGIKESPPNSNKVRYNTWYYGREVSGKAYPWCMVFCQWVFDQAKVKVPIRTASCTQMLQAAKQKNCFVNNQHLKPGDLVLFDFDKSGNTSEHCGIVRTVNGSIITTIEGNTGVGNDADGGMVMVRDRNRSLIIGAFRPIFDDEEDELDMTKSEFIKSLTDEEAYTLLTKALNHANKKSEPDWSRKEGHWATAKLKKIVGDNAPEGLVKRDELIAILGRMGIL